MVTPGTAFQSDTSVDLDQAAFEAAAELWVLLEGAEPMPMSTETRKDLDAARRSFQDWIATLEITEQMLCHHLRARLAPPGPSTASPPDGPE